MNFLKLLLKIKMIQEKMLDNNARIEVLDNEIVKAVENKEVNISSAKIDIQVMKDVLESKNLVEEE